MSRVEETLVLEHYRERGGGPFGMDGSGCTFDLASAISIRDALRACRAWGMATVTLQGPVLNPEPAHAETLATAFREHGAGATIGVARWLPHGSCTPDVVELLRRVRRLEMDYPSCGAKARRLFRVAYPHDAFASAMADLRAHAIDPIVCIWVGVPGDDRDTLLETLRQVYSLRPRRVQLRSVVAPPGSDLFANRERLGLTIESRPPYYVLGHYTADPLTCRLLLMMCRRSVGGYNAWRDLGERAAAPRQPQRDPRRSVSPGFGTGDQGP